jgi:hypothetical protein
MAAARVVWHGPEEGRTRQGDLSGGFHGVRDGKSYRARREAATVGARLLDIPLYVCMLRIDGPFPLCIVGGFGDDYEGENETRCIGSVVSLIRPRRTSTKRQAGSKQSGTLKELPSPKSLIRKKYFRTFLAPLRAVRGF